MSFLRQYKSAINDIRPNEYMMTYITRFGRFSSFDKDMVNNQMMMWRRLAKDNQIVILKCNNQSYKEESNGKTYYTFVVQSRDDDAEDPMCKTAFAIQDTIVNGFTYIFTSEINRDRVLDYVMKNIEFNY